MLLEVTPHLSFSHFLRFDTTISLPNLRHFNLVPKDIKQFNEYLDPFKVIRPLAHAISPRALAFYSLERLRHHTAVAIAFQCKDYKYMRSGTVGVFCFSVLLSVAYSKTSHLFSYLIEMSVTSMGGFLPRYLAFLSGTRAPRTGRMVFDQELPTPQPRLYAFFVYLFLPIWILYDWFRTLWRRYNRHRQSGG